VRPPSRLARQIGTLAAAAALSASLAGCAELLGGTSSGSASPSPTSTSTRPPTASTSTKPVDARQAQRLQRIMTPLIQAMNNPLPLNRVKIGILDDTHINAASAGGGEFYVTRGLLERANDQQLAGVLAHEIAHDDLHHVAKAQTLGAGVNIGMVILDQVVPGAGALAPIATQLVVNKYTQSEEYAADRHGAEILQKAGLPPTIMADTLTWLMQTEGSSGGGFFATHPATGDRIQALRNGR
jgi:Zn-dependent protease with chaperone function